MFSVACTDSIFKQFNCEFCVTRLEDLHRRATLFGRGGGRRRGGGGARPDTSVSITVEQRGGGGGGGGSGRTSTMLSK